MTKKQIQERLETMVLVDQAADALAIHLGLLSPDDESVMTDRERMTDAYFRLREAHRKLAGEGYIST